MPAGGGQRELAARPRAVIEAKNAENAVLRAELEAQLERYPWPELRVEELERRLGSDRTTSGMPPWKDKAMQAALAAEPVLAADETRST